jgi:hypothetical protein
VPVELLYLNPFPLKNVVEIKSVAPREVIGKHYLWGMRMQRGADHLCLEGVDNALFAI